MDRALEIWLVGTSTLVLVAVGALVSTHLAGHLAWILPAIGTAPATILFGYFWLLALVAAGSGSVVDSERDVRSTLVDAAMVGVFLAVVYLTVVLVVGFVAPVPAQLDPGSLPVASVVLGGIGLGALGGCVMAVYALVCSRIGAGIVARE